MKTVSPAPRIAETESPPRVIIRLSQARLVVLSPQLVWIARTLLKSAVMSKVHFASVGEVKAKITSPL